MSRAARDIERALVFAEDTQHFAGLIDGQLVCGAFAGAGTFVGGASAPMLFFPNR